MASMSSPVPLPLVGTQVGPLNPLEGIILGINTNPYFIGIMMLLLNLGGRFLGMEISKEQERFFQHPWVRRFLILTVLFIATRNIIVAFIMTIFVVYSNRFTHTLIDKHTLANLLLFIDWFISRDGQCEFGQKSFPACRKRDLLEQKPR